MINLCEVLGVEEGEEFNVEGKEGSYRIKDNILCKKCSGIWYDDGLSFNYFAKHNVKKQPFIPKKGEFYFTIMAKCMRLARYTNDYHLDDLLIISNGLAYRTEAEAEKYGIPKVIELKKSLGVE